MRQKIMRFMYGRRGVDELGRFLLGVWFVLSVLSIFVDSYILSAVQFIPSIAFFYRVFSRNLQKRDAENRAYLKYRNKVKDFFKFQKQKLCEIKTHRYIKCPGCKATLRVKRVIGKHTVNCPKCKNRFETNIRL